MRRLVSNFVLGASAYLDDLGRWIRPKKDPHPSLQSNEQLDLGITDRPSETALRVMEERNDRRPTWPPERTE